VPGKPSPGKVPGAPNNGSGGGGGGNGGPGTPTPRPTATPSPGATPTPVGTKTVTFRATDLPQNATTGPQPRIVSFVSVSGVTGQMRNITVAWKATIPNNNAIDSIRIFNPSTAPLTFGTSLYSDGNQPKLSGSDMGTGCTAFAGATTIDDRVGGGMLSSGTAPYAGAFTTNMASSTLIGMANQMRDPALANGDWLFQMFFENGGVGTLECLSLTLTWDDLP
jgi:hypothetical protein